MIPFISILKIQELPGAYPWTPSGLCSFIMDPALQHEQLLKPRQILSVEAEEASSVTHFGQSGIHQLHYYNILGIS